MATIFPPRDVPNRLFSERASSLAELQEHRNSESASASNAVRLASRWLSEDLDDKNTCVDAWPEATKHELRESIQVIQKTVTQALAPTFGSKRWSKLNQTEAAGISRAKQYLSNKALGFAELCERYRACKEACKESALSAQKAEDEEWAGLYGVEKHEGSQWGEDDITAESILAKRESILAKVREMATAVTNVSDILRVQQGMSRLEK